VKSVGEDAAQNVNVGIGPAVTAAATKAAWIMMVGVPASVQLFVLLLFQLLRSIVRPAMFQMVICPAAPLAAQAVLMINFGVHIQNPVCLKALSANQNVLQLSNIVKDCKDVSLRGNAIKLKNVLLQETAPLIVSAIVEDV
jgi:hypothetical protein